MKPLNRFTIIFSSVLCLLAPKKMVTACGFYVYPGEYRFWLLQPDLTNAPDLSPFYFASTYLFRDNYQKLDRESREINITEWYQLCKQQVPKKDIYDVQYDTSPDQFLLKMASPEKKNAFLRYLALPANKELLGYVQLSKRLEAIAARPDPWEESPNVNEHVSKAVQLGESLYRQSTASWIRLRTAYQLMRLYRYQHQFEAAKNIYDTRIAPMKSTSWIAAAALYQKAALVDYPESDYLYSKVFDMGNYRRADCLIEFRSKTMEQPLRLAKNDHERNVLYAMHALNYPGKSLDKLKMIYAAEPAYKELPFLLLREINKVEDWLMTSKVTSFSAATHDYSWQSATPEALTAYREDVAYAKTLYAFTKQVLQENKNRQPVLLNLYASHLALLLRDYTASAGYLAAARRYAPAEKNIQTQLTVNELMLQVLTQKKFGAAAEKRLLTVIKTPDEQLGVNSPDLLKDQLILFIAKKMIANGERARGLLLLGKTKRAIGELLIGTYKNVYQEMAEVALPADYDAMIDLIDQPGKTAFEQYISSGEVFSPWDYYNTEGDKEYMHTWNRYKILDCKATWYIQHQNLAAALATLKQVPDSFWKQEPYQTYIKGNPFFLNYYHSYGPLPGEGKDYTKKETIAGMLQLEKMAATDKSNAAQYYYELGNAWYNMSYHGKSWLISKQWWSIDELSNFNEDLKKTAINDNYYGCTNAKAYYLAALRATSSKSLAALCTFMAGKCDEQYNRYFAMAVSRDGYEPGNKNPYLGELKKKGISGNYYQEMVTECLTYQHFITAHNRQKQ